HLRLTTAQAKAAYRATRPLDGAAAYISIDYGGVRVDLPASNAHRMHEGKLVSVAIDEKLHTKTRNRLGSAGFQPFEPAPGQCAPEETALFLHESLVLHLVEHLLPAWRKSGWQISMAPDFAWQPVAIDAFELETQTVDNEWFTLELGLEIEGRRYSLYPMLATLLADETLTASVMKAAPDSAESVPVRIDGQRYVRFPLARLRTIVTSLLELSDRAPEEARTPLRLSRLDAARLVDLADGGFQWRSGGALRELADKLRRFDGIGSVAAPAGLAAALREYQQAGLSWLQFLRAHDLAGILADDMGLGKTVQTIAHLLCEKEAGRLQQPALIVAPTSLVHNWVVECERFAPGLRVLALHGPQRAPAFERMGEYDVVVSTYPLLPRDIEKLAQREFHLAVFDEAQNLKNAKTRAAEAARRLRARHRLALTGTPLENNLAELWSQFNPLLPGLLGDAKRFARCYRTPIEKHGDGARRAHLARRIKPFVLRRTKEQVARELPPKTEITRAVDLAGAQRDLYETVRATMEQRVREALAARGLAQSHIVVLDALLKLRQVCCDPRLLKLPAAAKVKESAKLELLSELLPELIAEGRRVLLFSQFTSMLALIEARLAELAINYVKLTGDTRDRKTPVTRFQKGEVPLFLISLKAGGTGLNLTAADTVIHYDPWWNPAVEDQATDRAHRIGQDKPVFVYRLLAAGTVEEKIRALQQRKADLARGVLDEDAALAKALTAEDFQSLFEPLPPG
ncbi:MAG TPA: DEAD/DEAH box helicase, partial [Burkholderiaceae bacterium]|nr:DEAD/DEAH box helicase [Burkholderiaceae bacterium]